MADFSQRFLFDDSDVRGELVALHESYQHVLAKHDYPPAVAQLLGELMAAAALLVGTLKFDGLLVLQARSSGAVPLLMVECSSARELRGIAQVNVALADLDHVTQDNARMAHDYAQSAERMDGSTGVLRRTLDVFRF